MLLTFSLFSARFIRQEKRRQKEYRDTKMRTQKESGDAAPRMLDDAAQDLNGAAQEMSDAAEKERSDAALGEIVKFHRQRGQLTSTGNDGELNGFCSLEDDAGGSNFNEPVNKRTPICKAGLFCYYCICTQIQWVEK